ncbi:MAG: hypothetical protein ACTSWN_06130 [Promethearchaeota archaeon]
MNRKAVRFTGVFLTFIRRWWLYIAVGLVIGFVFGYMHAIISALVI